LIIKQLTLYILNCS